VKIFHRGITILVFVKGEFHD